MLNRRFQSLAAAGLCLALASCNSTREAGGAAQPQQSIEGVVTTASGLQQFPVPQAGRDALAQRLTKLVPGHITDARISNAWRTAAAAKLHPGDYAACVSADAGNGTQVFLIVKSGPGTGDVISGPNAIERCADPARVTHWVTLPEALSLS